MLTPILPPQHWEAGLLSNTNLTYNPLLLGLGGYWPECVYGPGVSSPSCPAFPGPEAFFGYS